MEYNEENIIKLYSEGLSNSQIAAKLNTTSGAISGKINRMRVKGSDKLPPRLKPVHVERSTPVLKLKPNKYTIFTKPASYKHVSKAELREQLHRAVLNTK